MLLPRNLFVYGTLRDAENEYGALLRCSGEWVGAGRVKGRLYRIGRNRGMVYPGLVPSNEEGNWVRGEVYRLRAPGALYRVLDQYEGRDYPRDAIAVLLDSGEWVRAAVYRYAGSLTGKRRIASGDFLS
ncbi:MAG: gamma-glutamylcyclotransferase [Acidobacteriaceae bacterium]|nr:gamma-glutamylcyclotransferase [Acidobacteriaceae bacterium]